MVYPEEKAHKDCDTYVRYYVTDSLGPRTKKGNTSAHKGKQ